MESRLVEYAERIVDLAERRERGECVPTLTDSCTLSQPALAKEYLALRQDRERMQYERDAVMHAILCPFEHCERCAKDALLRKRLYSEAAKEFSR
jgi:hypothetical protein